jgi:light-regulated signal transduction histidine kinase (bacteriophytochrome)
MTDPIEVDFEACASEPIRVPGSVQTHGMLLTVDPATFEVVQVSANSRAFVGREPQQVLGESVDAIFSAASVRSLRSVVDEERMERGTTLLALDVELDGEHRPYDGVVHRSGGLLVIELLRVQGGPRPLTFTDACRRAQSRMAELHETSGYAELLAAAAQQMQTLTGFDRVMIYRFDADYNGQVVAEQRRDDLEPFLGLHYPATDIPAQARALYERNWIRLLADVDSEPAALLPRDDPRTGEPLDLGQAWLRAISPVHIRYLRSMGVTASMSVSLLRDGRLWGLIACHHYSGPHEPPYEVCVTAEMLGQILSARLVDAAERQRARREVDARAALAQLVAASHTTTSLAAAGTSGDVGIADLLPCTGALARVEGQTATAGAGLDPTVVERIDAAFAGQEPGAATRTRRPWSAARTAR